MTENDLIALLRGSHCCHNTNIDFDIFVVLDKQYGEKNATKSTYCIKHVVNIPSEELMGM